MITPELRLQIVAEAHSWESTPFHHQARLKGVGVDCAGVAVGVAKACGLVWHDVPGYSRRPSGMMFVTNLRQSLDSITFEELEPGDLMSFAITGEEQHIGIVTSTNPLRFIHAWESVGACRESSFDSAWRRRYRQAWRYRTE